MRTERMSERAPGAAVMEQVVRLRAAAPARTPLARMLGTHPLPAEALRWFTGAQGEREVGALLRRLPDGWTAFHALPVGSRDADVDHLVVGPGGVFVLNTKHHAGARVWVGDRAVMVAGQKKPYLRNSDLEAARVRGILTRAGIEAPVRAVVVIVAAKQVDVRQLPRLVDVVPAGRLLRWLIRRPAVLDGAAVERIVRLVDDPATWRRSPAADATTDGTETAAQFDAIEREVRGAQLVRIGWGLAAALGMVAVALPMLPLLPH